MSLGPDFFHHLAIQGDALYARVLSRDDAQLVPTRLTQAAAARLRAGIAALESWLRRVLLLMALTLEPGLQPRAQPWVKTHRPRLSPPHTTLRIFPRGDAPSRDQFDRLHGRYAAREPFSNGPVWAAPLLARLGALKALIDAPEARAKRLAFHLARRTPGCLQAPTYRGRTSGQRFGTEASTLFDAMGAAICERSRARPPPLGPAPRAGPRIRAL
ncbi:MAG: hypothetical protein AAF253_02560 [Pseudomonadota bacterium]